LTKIQTKSSTAATGATLQEYEEIISGIANTPDIFFFFSLLYYRSITMRSIVGK